MCLMADRSPVFQQVAAANTKYAGSFGNKSELALPPARHFAILTCMDARLDPAKYAGLAEGDAHVIRNAGGRASDDAIRSLGISHKLLGTNEWFVIYHSDCGMQLFTSEIIGDLLADDLGTAQFDGKKWSNSKHAGGSVAGKFIHWHTFEDNAKSVIEDVQRIRSHPLVPTHIPIYGFIYDVKSGHLNEVTEATVAGIGGAYTRRGSLDALRDNDVRSCESAGKTRAMHDTFGPRLCPAYQDSALRCLYRSCRG
jgi:carbonic anhydrase